MNRPVTSLVLPKYLIDKLQTNGYHYYEDIKNSDSQWVKNINTEILKNTRTFQVKTASEHWQLEKTLNTIPTFSKSLDDALGHGIKLGSLIEICGLPGSGKTQLCHQLCVNVQIPIEYGGLGGEAVYIDTSSNFSLPRIKDLAASCKNKLVDSTKHFSSIWETDVLKKIHYAEAFGLDKFCASIILLKELLNKNTNIKLVIIDSIAFPFKSACTDLVRTGILCRLISNLRQISMQKNIAIILTNEMSTRIGSGVVCALGDAWAHCTGMRMIISLPNVAITHNSEKPDTIAKIKVTKDGIRDY